MYDDVFFQKGWKGQACVGIVPLVEREKNPAEILTSVCTRVSFTGATQSARQAFTSGLSANDAMSSIFAVTISSWIDQQVLKMS